jgi:hypothetical protein
MIHGQIISGLYTTLINLSPMTYKERTKQREREREVLKLFGYGFRGLPSHPSSGRCCTQTPATPTRASAQGKCDGLAPVGPPNGPCWQPLHQRDPRSVLRSRTEPPPGNAFHQTFPTPGLDPGSLFQTGDQMGSTIC